jgi:hypothetical protein
MAGISHNAAFLFGADGVTEPSKAYEADMVGDNTSIHVVSGNHSAAVRSKDWGCKAML